MFRSLARATLNRMESLKRVVTLHGSDSSTLAGSYAFKLDERIAGAHHVANAKKHSLHLSSLVGREIVLHLHSLVDHHRVALLDLVSRFHLHLEDRAAHGSVDCRAGNLHGSFFSFLSRLGSAVAMLSLALVGEVSLGYGREKLQEKHLLLVGGKRNVAIFRHQRILGFLVG